jgi:hypothetical protein
MHSGYQPRGRDHDMTPSTSDHWITSLSILAFVRVALMLLAIISGLVPTNSLLDAVIGIILGIGAYRHQLWSGYGLILWAAHSVALEIALDVGSGGFSFVWLVLYTIGTIHLYRSKGFASLPHLRLWFILRWGVWLLFLGFLAGFLRTFALPILTTLLGAPSSASRFWSISIATYVLILASQAVAAKRAGAWALEHVLCIALVVVVVGASLDVYIGQPVALSLYGSFYTFVLTFIGWGIAERLKPQPLYTP